MPNFRIWFSGLCHFVQNEDPNARCRVCVVIPKASGEQGRNDHEVKMSYADLVQRRGRRVIDHGERIGDRLNRRRVTFEVTRSGRVKPVPPLELPQDKETFFFRLSEIAGIYADKDPSIVTTDPAPSVAAQVLLEQGIFGFDDRLSIVRPWEVIDLDENDIVRDVADPVYVEIPEVESVVARVAAMDGSSMKEFPLKQNSGDDIEIIIGARCDKGGAGINLERRLEPNRVILVQVDHDFAFHYDLLHECSRGALEQHPTIQERVRSQAARFPIPESRMVEFFISPFLAQALQSADEDPGAPDTNSGTEAPADRGDMSGSEPAREAGATSEMKITDGVELETIAQSILRGDATTVEAITTAMSFESLLTALEEAIRSSGATCDCLPCDGRARVFNLDQHLPGNASIEESRQHRGTEKY
jgi:hypothetical protein